MSKKSSDKDKKEKKSTSKKPDEKKSSDATDLGNKQFEVEEDEVEEKKGKVGTALQKFTRDQSYMMHVQQFLEVKGDQVHIRSRDSLANIRSLVACIGPPGAGKSTLCNALLGAGYGTKFTFFEPSSSIASYTKGLWVLAQRVRMELPAMRWEVMDMEGFQPDLFSSWGMTMVLSLLAEIVIFCNRDARYDSLFKAAEVFQKGRDLSSQFGMKPVTKQIFVQLEEGMDQEDIDACLKKIRECVPNIQIDSFQIPHIRNKNKKDHEFVTFHDDMKESVLDLVKKFNFPSSSDAVASRSKHIASLLEAFNDSDLKKCSDISQEFLRADCERIYKATIAIYRNECFHAALKLKLESTETTLEQFMGNAIPINFDFTVSAFYVEGSSEVFCEKFLEEQPKVLPNDFYKSVYDDKMQDLMVLKERAAKCTTDEELAYLNETNEFIEKRKLELLKYIATLKYGQKITNDGQEILNSRKHEQRGMFLGMDAEDRSAFVPDFTSYFLFVRQQNEALESMWAAQTAKAQWKAPCGAHGKMECQHGHKIKMNPSILCDKKIKDENGKLVDCGGQWYWVDGPEQFAMCNGKCATVKKMEPGLKCVKCNADLLCSIRTTDYYP